MLEGVTIRVHASVVELGMVDDVTVDGSGRVRITVALTTAGCPLRAQIKKDVESKVRGLPGVSDVEVAYGEMTPEQKSAAMARARFNARENAAVTEVPPTTRTLAVASGKGGVGKSSVTVNLAVALAARGFRVGVLDADIWGFSVPRMLGVDGRLGGADGKIHPHVVDVGGSEVKVVSMGFLVDDEETALMWRGLILTRALEQFLTDVRWGPMDYLLIDMPPGTGDVQMGLARLLPQAEVIVVTTPARAAQKVRGARGRHGPPLLHEGRRRGREHVGVRGARRERGPHLRERRRGRPGRGDRRTARGVGPHRAGGVGGRRRGSPVALTDPDGPAGRAFAELARRVAEELMPPVEMAGCTARIADRGRPGREGREGGGGRRRSRRLAAGGPVDRSRRSGGLPDDLWSRPAARPSRAQLDEVGEHLHPGDVVQGRGRVHVDAFHDLGGHGPGRRRGRRGSGAPGPRGGGCSRRCTRGVVR